MFNVTPKTIRAIIPLPLLLTLNITPSLAGVVEASVARENSQIATAPSQPLQLSLVAIANLEQESQPSSALHTPTTSVQMQNFDISKGRQRLVWARAARNEKTRECRVSGLCS